MLLFLNLNLAQAQNSSLIYVGDPMCSWCYGVSEELNEVEKHFEGQLEFEIVMGGLRPYNKQTMSDLKSFLTHHWEEVNKASGQTFKYDILDSQDITYDTEPPCRATVVVRDMDKDKAFDFFKAIQAAFYADNKNMHLVDSYYEVLDMLALDKEKFKELFESDSYKLKVREDFVRSGELGVKGFPTLLLYHNGQVTTIANGFAKSNSMIKSIEGHLK